ncbi:LysR family transcriptional regulator [Pseudoalteromonas sp. MMG022]|uniref:LysR family transcriptional regulator n=1 Tax=Pseudoalteromonas sp. MMG022 TaxID=2909978 RepID=UPI001F1A680D|nr:LysR family transcriptional regulator [Pseudoalteromonas sp. MMG022]MCF6434609.1 LysR family transcriptional regulator [Pseudoalteromonas sp. MMG022]
MQSWDDFQLLLALNSAHTLRGAAKLLGINHTTVARRLHSLNQRYPIAVCTTTQNKLVFSELGEQLLTTAKAMQAQLQSQLPAIQSTIKQAKQQVNLSLPPAILQFVLMDVLSEFQALHPDILLNINTTYALSDLDSSEADVVVRASDQLDDYLVGHRLCPISLGYFMHRDYLNNSSEKDITWIVAHSQSRPAWLAETPFPNASVNLVIEDLVLRHQAAANGLGMIRGAHYIAQHFPQLVEFAPSSDSFADLWVLTHPNKQSLPNVKKLIQFLLTVMRNKQSLINQKVKSA